MHVPFVCLVAFDIKLYAMNKRRRRHSLRYSGWDYHQSGYYFITICTHNRKCLFDQPCLRHIAETYWQKIPSYKSPVPVWLDEWVVMPNHVHGIIHLEIATEIEQKKLPPKSGTAGILIGTYKAAVSKRINYLAQNYGASIWQRGFYDRIIRNQQELQAIRHYIRENPKRWHEDTNNLDKLTTRMTYHP